MLGESAIAVRTKAMKCLSEVVAADPSILARVSHSVLYSAFITDKNIYIFNLSFLKGDIVIA